MRNRKRTDYIVIHTAASMDVSVNAAVIDHWHRRRGFECIGYHYVIKMNGEEEVGRPENAIGAHCLGLNNSSIGICVVGHGDFFRFRDEQYEKLRWRVQDLRKRYWDMRYPEVIGHREVNDLITAGKVPARYRTNKTCPGKLINMDALRDYLL